ncbi:MAG: hypothetical protein BKP49_04920 [Treponema sp. CETP13]|nr:MAG: hypothetical protein BKP49_04920 [Treponema sp. CETP13]
MIFVVLNLALAILLFLFSSKIVVPTGESSIRSLVNMILLVAFNGLIGTGLFIIGSQSEFAIALCRVYLFGTAFLFVLITNYVFLYPDKKSNVFSKLFSLVFVIFSFYIMFFKFQISFTSKSGILINSENIDILGLSWYKLYFLLYYIAFPCLGLIGGIIGAIWAKNQLIRQQILNLVFDIILGELLLVLILIVSKQNSELLYIGLIPIVQAIVLFLFYISSQRTVLKDASIIFSDIGRFILNYLLTAILIGISFAFFYLKLSNNFGLFLFLMVLTFTLIVFLRVKTSKLFERVLANNSTHYDKQLEKDLANIDYTMPDLDIKTTFTNSLQRNINVDSVSILLDSGDGIMRPIDPEDKIHMDGILLDNMIFNHLVNENVNVVLRNKINGTHAFFPIAQDLKNLMDMNGARVLIVLREGGNVFGVILLGDKRLGNLYNDYDLKILNKLYSYFFLAGYYLKNIVNEDVVGTISREIQFSGQVIKSIQENIDIINNPKFDIGYLSKSAHDIGSEYIDFVRLSPTRHMIVLGDMSGKGLSASMSVVIMKSVLKTFLAETPDFKELVQKLNLFIRDNLPRGTFFAGVIGLLDEEKNIFYYVNCGTPGLFVYNHVYNNVIEIQGKGRILGFAKNILNLISVKKVELTPGDILFTCTDGFIEQKSLRNEKYGKERFQHAVIDNMSFSSERICKFVYKELLDFTSQELQDDVSAMVIKIQDV